MYELDFRVYFFLELVACSCRLAYSNPMFWTVSVLTSGLELIMLVCPLSDRSSSKPQGTSTSTNLPQTSPDPSASP